MKISSHKSVLINEVGFYRFWSDSGFFDFLLNFWFKLLIGFVSSNDIFLLLTSRSIEFFSFLFLNKSLSFNFKLYFGGSYSVNNFFIYILNFLFLFILFIFFFFCLAIRCYLLYLYYYFLFCFLS